MAATLQNGINLAYWLYKVHPSLFQALQRQVGRPTLGALGDDTIDFSSNTDAGQFATDTSTVSAAITPDLVSLPAPQLQDVTIDAALTTPSFNIPDAAAGSAGSSSSQAGGSLSSALAGVGSFLTSATGLTALSNLATAVYKANTPQAATIATQIGRVGAGANPAPITYAYNAAGQLVPVLAQTNAAGIPLNSSTLASLVPSSMSSLIIPIGIGLIVLLALSGGGKK